MTTTYTLKLVSGTNYNLYEGATLVLDYDLEVLFRDAGEAYFVFDFDGGTPTSTTDLTIINSSSQAIITNTGLSGIAEDVNFKGVWGNSATAFSSFARLEGVALDEAQLSNLMWRIKNAGGGVNVTSVDFSTDIEFDTLVTNILPAGTTKTAMFIANNVDSNAHNIYFVSDISGRRIQINAGCQIMFIASRYNVQSGTYMSGIAYAQSPDTPYSFLERTGGVAATRYIAQIGTDNPMNFNLQNSVLAVSQTAGTALAQRVVGLSSLSVTLPTPLAWTSVGSGSSYTKRALQVSVNVSETSLSLSADSWNTLYTLPDGFRPTVIMEGTVTVLDSGVLEASYIKVNTDGTVQVRAFGNTTEVHGSIVFPVTS